VWLPNGKAASCQGAIHVVQPGETFAVIATTICHTNVNAVVVANSHIKDTSRLCPGDEVCCPATCTTPPQPVDHSTGMDCTIPTPSGDSCMPICGIGYHPFGNYYCNDGQWATPSPSCGTSLPPPEKQPWDVDSDHTLALQTQIAMMLLTDDWYAAKENGNRAGMDKLILQAIAVRSGTSGVLEWSLLDEVHKFFAEDRFKQVYGKTIEDVYFEATSRNSVVDPTLCAQLALNGALTAEQWTKCRLVALTRNVVKIDQNALPSTSYVYFNAFRRIPAGSGIVPKELYGSGVNNKGDDVPVDFATFDSLECCPVFSGEVTPPNCPNCPWESEAIDSANSIINLGTLGTKYHAVDMFTWFLCGGSETHTFGLAYPDCEDRWQHSKDNGHTRVYDQQFTSLIGGDSNSGRLYDKESDDIITIVPRLMYGISGSYDIVSVIEKKGYDFVTTYGGPTGGKDCESLLKAICYDWYLAMGRYRTYSLITDISSYPCDGNTRECLLFTWKYNLRDNYRWYTERGDEQKLFHNMHLGGLAQEYKIEGQVAHERRVYAGYH
jgi:hypothetical protein